MTKPKDLITYISVTSVLIVIVNFEESVSAVSVNPEVSTRNC